MAMNKLVERFSSLKSQFFLDAKVIQKIRTDRFGHLAGDALWTSEEELTLTKIISDIQSGIPEQYAIGYTYWYQWLWKIDSRALIPRPETEELLEWLVSVHGDEEMSCLDIGTGSGILAIGMALIMERSSVTAIDISQGALYLCRENAERLQADIHLQQLDFLDKTGHSQLGKYNLIVSNPPYIPQHEKALMSDNVLDHEPHLALFTDSDDGQDFYHAIAHFGESHLSQGGWVYLELNEYRAQETALHFRESGYHNVQIKRDLQGKERMLRAQWIR